MHARNSVLAGPGISSLYAKVGFILALTVITFIITGLVPEPKAGGEAGVVMDLPDQVGPLYAFPDSVTKAEYDILPKDTTFARKKYGTADSTSQDRILCSIILSGAERRSIHRPERCLPSQGWRITTSHTETVPLASGRDLKVTALLLERKVTLVDGSPFTIRNYYLYWFVGKGITTPYQFQRILMTNWDLLAHRVNQRWAYVIISKDISKDWRPDGLDADETLATLKQFIHDSVPTFMKSEMPEDKTASK